MHSQAGFARVLQQAETIRIGRFPEPRSGGSGKGLARTSEEGARPVQKNGGKVPVFQQSFPQQLKGLLAL